MNFSGELSSQKNIDGMASSESDRIFDYDLIQSPFASVIGTNYIASREDIEHLEALLTEPKLRLSQLELEIAQSQDLPETLSLKRDSVKRYIEAHRVLLSPMRRLPAETLSEIFTHCLPKDHYAVRDLSEAPLLLTRVSRQWRQTAIGTPALWKSLHIVFPQGMSLRGVKRRSLGFSVWLKRSGSLPLSISLSVGMGQPPKSAKSNPIDGFIAVVLQYSSRVKELSFTGSSMFDIADHLDRLASQCFPLLTVFRVRDTDPVYLDPTEELPFPFASLVRQMPALNNLMMIGFTHSGRHYPQLELEWQNLTELVIHPLPSCPFSASFSSRELLGILGHAPRLQSLTLYINITSWDTEITVLNFPALREMRLTFVSVGQEISWTSFRDLYRSFVCPSLKTLYTKWVGLFMKKMLFSFASESMAELETLHLGMPLTPSTLIECLSLVPKLRFLEIDNRALVDDGDSSRDIPPSLAYTVDDSVLKSLNLVTSEGSHSLCPDLQHIRILYPEKFHSTFSITYDALFTLLESRVQTRILQSCDVLFLKDSLVQCTLIEIRRFRALVDSGLKLRIRYCQYTNNDATSSYDDTPQAGLLTLPDFSVLDGSLGLNVIP